MMRRRCSLPPFAATMASHCRCVTATRTHRHRPHGSSFSVEASRPPAACLRARDGGGRFARPSAPLQPLYPPFTPSSLRGGPLFGSFICPRKPARRLRRRIAWATGAGTDSRGTGVVVNQTSQPSHTQPSHPHTPPRHLSSLALLLPPVPVAAPPPAPPCLLPAVAPPSCPGIHPFPIPHSPGWASLPPSLHPNLNRGKARFGSSLASRRARRRSRRWWRGSRSRRATRTTSRSGSTGATESSGSSRSGSPR